MTHYAFFVVMNDKPIALDAYEALADGYASVVDTKPHNAYYERPATLSLLRDVKGKRVLDAACGPGVYSEWLVSRGAEVVALDASPRMLELAKQRVGKAVDVRQADLRKPLTFLDSASFDVVLSSLTMHYLEDWHTPFKEFTECCGPRDISYFPSRTRSSITSISNRIIISGQS